MRSYYARVEHKVVVGDIVNLLAVTSLILIRWHRGMKRPGPTLHVRSYVRPFPPTDMHKLHKVVGGCLSLPL